MQVYQLLNRISETTDLGTILDLAYEILGNPMFLSDNSHNVLAHTTAGSKIDEKWNLIVSRQEMDFPIVTKQFSPSQVRHESLVRKEAVLLQDDDAPFDRYVLVLSDKGAIYGTLVLCASIHPFGPEDGAILKLVGHFVLEQMLRKNPSVTDLQGYFQRLLSGVDRTAEEVDRDLARLGWTPRQYLYALCINRREPAPAVSADRLLQELGTISGLRPFRFDGSIVCLYDTASPVLEWSAFPRLAELAEEYSFCIGISKVFHHVNLLRAGFIQAQGAVALGECLQHNTYLYIYENYSIYHVLKMIATHSDLRSYCCDSILALEKYDREHNTELLKTLQIYLESNRSFSHTAEALFIHRNTASYRIEKCKSIMNTDFNNAIELFSLQFSLKILELLRFWESAESKNTRQEPPNPQ